MSAMSGGGTPCGRFLSQLRGQRPDHKGDRRRLDPLRDLLLFPFGFQRVWCGATKHWLEWSGLGRQDGMGTGGSGTGTTLGQLNGNEVVGREVFFPRGIGERDSTTPGDLVR